MTECWTDEKTHNCTQFCMSVFQLPRLVMTPHELYRKRLPEARLLCRPSLHTQTGGPLITSVQIFIRHFKIKLLRKWLIKRNYVVVILLKQ